MMLITTDIVVVVVVAAEVLLVEVAAMVAIVVTTHIPVNKMAAWRTGNKGKVHWRGLQNSLTDMWMSNHRASFCGLSVMITVSYLDP
jgi:hypothetical protein